MEFYYTQFIFNNLSPVAAWAVVELCFMSWLKLAGIE